MSKIPPRKAKLKTSDKPKTKAEQVLGLLRRPLGASISDLMKSTGWQAHSIRGFLSGTLGKRRGLMIASDTVDGERRYRIVQTDSTS